MPKLLKIESDPAYTKGLKILGLGFDEAGFWVIDGVTKGTVERALAAMDETGLSYRYCFDDEPWVRRYHTSDPVRQPSHYNNCRAECIDIIEDLGFGFYLGNALKYLWRCKSKGKMIEDLQKAQFYISFYLFTKGAGPDPRKGA